jgi:hypothetical protein
LNVVFDPEAQIAYVIRADDPPERLGADGELIVPAIVHDFRIVVGRFLA